jgi:hypothetical protein
VFTNPSARVLIAVENLMLKNVKNKVCLGIMNFGSV